MNTARRIGIGASIGLALVAVLWLALSPYLTLNRMQAAIAAKDGQQVSRYIDFESLRTSIKDQVAADMLRRGAAQGKTPAEVAKSVVMVGAVIDAFVQPDVIVTMLTDLKSPNNPIGGKVVGKVKVHRTGLTRFVVSGDRKGGVVFEMRGLGWKMVGVDPSL